MTKNVFVLYGSKSCSQAADLLKCWKALLLDTDFAQCILVLVGNQDNYKPEGITQEYINLMGNRIVCLDRLQSGHGGQIARYLSQNLINGADRILLTCVCSFAQNEFPLDGGILRQCIKEFKAELGEVPHPILYMMLSREAKARDIQAQFAKAFADAGGIDDGSLYLLSEEDKNMNIKSESFRWNAVFCELALQVIKPRFYQANKVYSLGYSVLNEGNDELDRAELQLLRNTLLIPAIDDNQSKAAKVTWQMLNANVELPTSVNIEQVCDSWVSYLVKSIYHEPSAQTIRNNRILGGVDNEGFMDSSYVNHAKRFFEMNLSLTDRLNQVDQWFNNRLESMLRSTASVALRSENSKDFLKWVVNTLQRIEVGITPAVSITELPPKKWSETIQAYRERACAQIEVAAKKYAIDVLRKAVAERIVSNVKKLLDFSSSMMNVQSILTDVTLTPTRFQELINNQYSVYFGKVMNELNDHKSKYNEILTHSKEPLYRMDGSIDKVSWRRLLEHIQNEVHNRVQRGDYFNVLTMQYSTDNAMTDFLNNHLQAGAVMLRTMLQLGAPETDYLVCDELMNHPWVHANDANAKIVDTDNVERIDRYIVENTTMDDLVSANPNDFCFFKQNDKTSVEPLQPLQELRTITSDIFGNEPLQQVIEAEPDKKTVPKTRRQVWTERRNGHSILFWNWPAFVQTALVSVRQGSNKLIDRTPVTVHSETLDLSTYLGQELPIGIMDVLVECFNEHGEKIVLSGTVSGAMTDLKYRLHSENSSTTLQIVCDALNLQDALLCESGGEGQTYYPLQGSGTFKGLHFIGKPQIIHNPKNQTHELNIINR